MKYHTIKPVLSEETQHAMTTSWLEQGVSLQEALGISSDKMLEYYEYAQKLYEDKQLQDAADIFFLLSIVNPYVYEIWLARALSENSLGNHDECMHSAHMALSLDPSRQDAYLFLIEYFKSRNEHDAASELTRLMEQLATIGEKNDRR